MVENDNRGGRAPEECAEMWLEEIQHRNSTVMQYYIYLACHCNEPKHAIDKIEGMQTVTVAKEKWR
jgi:hypothetical protein